MTRTQDEHDLEPGRDAGLGAGLDPVECWRLLRGAQRGRIAVAAGGSIDIVCVDLVVDGAALAFPSAPGAAPLELALDDRIALEADGDDAHGHWSVVAIGRATPLERRSDIERVEALGGRRWPAAPPRRWMRIAVDGVRGRRAPSPDRATGLRQE